MKAKNKVSQANNGPTVNSLGLGSKRLKGVHASESYIDAVSFESNKRASQDKPALGKIFGYAVKSVAICALVIPSPQLALAGTTTIIDGPVNGTQSINGNDSLLITPTGSITTTNTAQLAIDAQNGSNTIINSGTISTAGYHANGIYADSGGVIINNFGSIGTIGDSSDGISAYYGGNTINNSGIIRTQGLSANAIYEGGSSNTINNFGTISTTGSGNGISVQGNINVINNAGSIVLAGGNEKGIYSQGNFNAVTNTGSISSSTGISYSGDSGVITNAITGTISSLGAIEVDGNSNKITNQGLIDTSYIGIDLYSSDRNSIANYGSILVSGASGSGVHTDFSKYNTIVNSGAITVSGAGGYGINLINDSSYNTITNSGAISVSGAGGYGVYAQGDSNAITNTGSINVSGAGGYGVYAQGNANTVTNSGDIVSNNGYAIYFDGSGNTFNSVNNFISGGIYMGSNAIVSLTTGANYSKLYTFEGSLSAINGSGPVPLFKNLATQQAGTYDPTLLASSSDALGDMTNTISSLIPGRFNGTDNQHPVWAKGFGIKSSYAGTTATFDRNYSFSGVAIGYDAMRTKDLTLGVMGGYGQSGLTADGKTAQSFNSASDDGFMGLYGQKRWKNVAVDFALYGGVQSFQQQRYVNDNLAYLGNSSAKSSYQGWWISPEAGVTYDAGQISGWSILPTARLRYAQQWLGGHSESGGGSANATVNGRSVAIGQSFIGLGTRKTIKTNLGKDTKMVLDGQIGYIYRGVVGDNTAGVTMIGQSLALPTEASSRSAVALSAGVTLDLSNAVALKIRGDFEAGGGMNYVGGGWAGLSVKF